MANTDTTVPDPMQKRRAYLLLVLLFIFPMLFFPGKTRSGGSAA